MQANIPHRKVLYHLIFPCLYRVSERYSDRANNSRTILMKGIIVGICISPIKKQPMQTVEQALALAGRGLERDRYADGAGSYSKGEVGRRQITFMSERFFPNSGFTFADSRRNVFVRSTEGLELYKLLPDRLFRIGDAIFRAVKYCDLCGEPDKLITPRERSFRETFLDCGGIVADIITGGILKVGDTLVSPP